MHQNAGDVLVYSTENIQVENMEARRGPQKETGVWLKERSGE